MAINITVDNRIRIARQDIDSDLERQLKLEFTHENPKREALRRMGLPHWGEPKRFETWGETEDELSLPRGGMPRVRKILEDAGVHRRVIDRRVQGSPEGRQIPKHSMKLYGYQEEAVRVCCDRECGLMRAPTGCGKTTVGFAIASRLKVATLVIVYNAGLFDQWCKRAERELGIDDIGVIRGNKRKLRPLTIAMQQTINARGVDAEMAQYFGNVIQDEVQRAPARTAFQAVDPFPARYRLGISADNRRKDKLECLGHDLFGEVLIDIKRADLIKSGHVLDVQVKIVPTDFEADWYGMPTEERPESEINTVKLTSEMMEDDARNQLIFAVVAQEQRDEQVLVLSHRREHCMRLDQLFVAMGIKTGFLIGGEENRVEFRRSVEGVERGTIRVGVGTFQAIGQGLDLPGVSVGVCATPIASNRQVFNQVRGRFCRTSKGKQDARLYYLWDQHVFGIKHVQNIVQWNANVVVMNDRGEWIEGREFLRLQGV